MHTMNAINKTLVALLLTAGLAGHALADTLAGNAPYAVQSFGQQADAGSGSYVQTFATPTDTVLEAIQWWGFHGVSSGGAGYDSFVVTLDGVVQSGTLTSMAVTATDGSYLYDLYTLDLADAQLTASTLGIVNGSSDVEWYWQSAAAIGNPGQASATDVAFGLLGHAAAVPEPGTFTLLLLGLAGLAGLRARLIR